MANALFVFDHKYPIDSKGQVYYSSGFDKDFFERYFDIFDGFDVFGRLVDIGGAVATPIDLDSFPTKFTLIKSNKRLNMAYSLLKKDILDHDCVICRMPSLFGALAINICKRYKVPYIIEIVACTYDALADSPSWKRRVMAYPAEIIYRMVLRNNPFNIYVTKEFLQRKYPTTGSSIAISNVTLPGVEACVLTKRLDKIGKFNPKGKIIIGTTSTLNVDFKGQKYVIKALPALVAAGFDVEYQLVGDGDGSWLLNIADELGVNERIKIIGRLNHDDVFGWLDTIDLYVHPSSQEGLSRAIIEAMSRACPVVACDTGGIHELIDEPYIVPKKSVLSLGTAIKALLSGDMASVAQDNFENSKEYVKDLLYKKRKDYYNNFMKQFGI